MKNELQKVLKYILDQQCGVVASPERPGNNSSNLSAIQSAYVSVNKSQSSWAKRHQSSPSKTDDLPRFISDEIRLAVVSELVDSMKAPLKSGNTAGLSNVAAITAQIKQDRTLLYLVEIAEKCKGDADLLELPTDREFDLTVKAALMLAALQSRAESNVNVSTLRLLDESAVFSEIKNFFASTEVAKMVGLLINHHAVLVKKRVLKQKEAETLIQSAVINFECSSVDSKLINQCVIDSLTHAIASEPDGRKDDYSAQFNANANSGQFFQRSKLHKSNLSGGDAKKTGLEEFDQPEIEDYYQ